MDRLGAAVHAGAVSVARWVGAVCVGAALVGCSADPTEDRNAARLIVDDEGAVTLRATGRDLLTLAAHPVMARTYTERVEGALAIYDFTRSDVVERDVAWDAGDLMVEHAAESSTFTLAVDGPADSLTLAVRCDTGGTFHGFGEQYHVTDQRGEAFDLIVGEQGIGRDGAIRPLTGDRHTTYFPMPYYLDARGFGVLFHTDARVVVDLCVSDPSVATFEVTSGAPLRWTVFHGPTPLDVIRQLGDVVGRPKRPPDWGLGIWVAAQGGRDAVLAEADALAAADISFDALWVQDWTGIRANADGGFGVEYRWQADDTLYPDLAGMVATLHGRGLKFLAYANPFIATNLPNHFPDMDRDGLLAKTPDTGESYVTIAPNGMSAHPDLTLPAARDYIKTQLSAMVTDYGFDGWMTDFAEWLPLDAALSDGSDAAEAHNRYPEAWQRLTREVMETLRPDGDWVMFARSGWTGVQDAAMIHWVGDQEADWHDTDGLPTVVPALLTLGLSGQPFVTLDIGGFSGGPSTKELWLRWVELGAFAPTMRTHEGAKKLQNWSWEKDAESTAHFRRFARVHRALEPEIRRLADEAAATSAPILRHLMLVFPEDVASRAVHDQFLLGDALLVAPVVTEGATQREVYLPPGATWFDVWTGDRYDGGQRVVIDAPIGSPPAFSRDADRDDLRAIPR